MKQSTIPIIWSSDNATQDAHLAAAAYLARYRGRTLEAYRHDQVPLHSATSILWSWALRFDSAYVQDQAFFAPFPETLLAIHDSGKGREHRT